MIFDIFFRVLVLSKWENHIKLKLITLDSHSDSLPCATVLLLDEGHNSGVDNIDLEPLMCILLPVLDGCLSIPFLPNFTQKILNIMHSLFFFESSNLQCEDFVSIIWRVLCGDDDVFLPFLSQKVTSLKIFR